MADDRRSLRAPNPTGETLRFVIAFILVILIFATCFTLPLLVSSWVHPAVGALAAILAMGVWVYLGPPPMPGLINGIIAINGLIALFGVFVVCVFRAICLWWL